MRTLEAIKKLAKKVCSSANDNDLTAVRTIDEGLNFIAEKYDFSSGSSANLLREPVTIIGKKEGELNSFVNLDYNIGLQEEKKYRIKYKYKNQDYSVEDTANKLNGYGDGIFLISFNISPDIPSYSTKNIISSGAKYEDGVVNDPNSSYILSAEANEGDGFVIISVEEVTE